MNNIPHLYAAVAELADAPDLGSGGNTVGVQVPSAAPEKTVDSIESTVFSGLFAVV